jgi:hypothetical protein
VEDEWLIVFLLRELSRNFSDLWIRVSDSDGEFLLVEAANALPRWLNPEIADYRVNPEPMFLQELKLTFSGLDPRWATTHHTHKFYQCVRGSTKGGRSPQAPDSGGGV